MAILLDLGLCTPEDSCPLKVDRSNPISCKLMLIREQPTPEGESYHTREPSAVSEALLFHRWIAKD